MMLATAKACLACGVEKPLADFHKHPRGRLGCQTQCKECMTAARRERRESTRCRKYGISVGDLDFMLIEQEGRCAICGVDGGLDLVIDHDHETTEVRGLLCGGCNKAIGFMQDNAERLEAAADYLRKRRFT